MSMARIYGVLLLIQLAGGGGQATAATLTGNGNGTVTDNSDWVGLAAGGGGRHGLGGRPELLQGALPGRPE